MHLYKFPRPCLLYVVFKSEESELQLGKVFGEVRSVTPLLEPQPGVQRAESNAPEAVTP